MTDFICFRSTVILLTCALFLVYPVEANRDANRLFEDLLSDYNKVRNSFILPFSHEKFLI